MRLDRLPIAMKAELATLCGEIVTFGTSLARRSSCGPSDIRGCLRSGPSPLNFGVGPGHDESSALHAHYRKKLRVTANSPKPPLIARPRQGVNLTAGECWQLLASVSIGRVVFTHRAMPAIRPVNHFIDGRTIIIRTHDGAAIASRAMEQSADSEGRPAGSVVCYEADDLDPVRHTGWSVIATGFARLVTDPDDIARYAAVTEPWIAGEMNQVVAIEPQFITGLRLVGWCT